MYAGCTKEQVGDYNDRNLVVVHVVENNFTCSAWAAVKHKQYGKVGSSTLITNDIIIHMS